MNLNNARKVFIKIKPLCQRYFGGCYLFFRVRYHSPSGNPELYNTVIRKLGKTKFQFLLTAVEPMTGTSCFRVSVSLSFVYKTKYFSQDLIFIAKIYFSLVLFFQLPFWLTDFLSLFKESTDQSLQSRTHCRDSKIRFDYC